MMPGTAALSASSGLLPAAGDANAAAPGAPAEGAPSFAETLAGVGAVPPHPTSDASRMMASSAPASLVEQAAAQPAPMVSDADLAPVMTAMLSLPTITPAMEAPSPDRAGGEAGAGAAAAQVAPQPSDALPMPATAPLPRQDASSASVDAASGAPIAVATPMLPMSASPSTPADAPVAPAQASVPAIAASPRERASPREPKSGRAAKVRAADSRQGAGDPFPASPLSVPQMATLLPGQAPAVRQDGQAGTKRDFRGSESETRTVSTAARADIAGSASHGADGHADGASDPATVNAPAGPGERRDFAWVDRLAAGQSVSPQTLNERRPADPASSPPATAALMSARAAMPASRAEAGPSVRKASHDASPAAKAEATAPSDDAEQMQSTSATGQPVTQQATSTALDPAAGTGAGRQLADGVADRQLDLARQGAWLDGLARDIAAAGDMSASGTLRFQVAPQHLGPVQVELKHGDDGPAVTLTASSEASRSALADAKPQLVAEARAHGIHLADTQVDLGGSDARSGGDPSQQQPQQSAEPRHAAHGGANVSAQAGGGQGGGAGNGWSQTRSQPLAANRSRDGLAEQAGKGDETAPAPSAAAARYA